MVVIFFVETLEENELEVTYHVNFLSVRLHDIINYDVELGLLVYPCCMK